MRKFVEGFIDDLLIYSQTIEEHIQHIEEVLRRLRKAGLTVHPSKIKVCVQEVKYLGHIITPGHVRPNPDKIAAIKDFPAPTKVKNLQQFLGLAGYYRRFIPHYSEISKPLTRLLEKDAVWEWSPAQKEAFELIKQALINTMGTDLPDLNKPFTIQTDASGVGLGAILLQEVGEGENAEMRPIYFASRGLTKAKANYIATELECLAVIWAIKKFKNYIEYSHFTVETDHQALKWLQTLKEPSGRLARWSLQLQGMNYSVNYRKGSSNNAADALSRNPINNDGDMEGLMGYIVEDQMVEGLVGQAAALVPNDYPTHDEFLQAHLGDHDLGPVVRFLGRDVLPTDPSEARRVVKLAGHRCLKNRILYQRVITPDPDSDLQLDSEHVAFGGSIVKGMYTWKIEVPKNLRFAVIRWFHDPPLAGH